MLSMWKLKWAAKPHVYCFVKVAKEQEAIIKFDFTFSVPICRDKR